MYIYLISLIPKFKFALKFFLSTFDLMSAWFECKILIASFAVV